MKTFIGIDPGQKGFVSVIFPDGHYEFCSIADTDVLYINRYLADVKARSEQVVAVMEDVHSIFGSSAKSTFAFGEIKGLLRGLLIANEIPYSLVPPKLWQAGVWDHCDMVVSFKTVKRGDKEVKQKVVDTKATTFNAARRLFPSVDFRKTERCKNLDDNKADSMLMAEFARRRNL